MDDTYHLRLAVAYICDAIHAAERALEANDIDASNVEEFRLKAEAELKRSLPQRPPE